MKYPRRRIKCSRRHYISDSKPAVESDGVGRYNTPPPPLTSPIWGYILMTTHPLSSSSIKSFLLLNASRFLLSSYLCLLIFPLSGSLCVACLSMLTSDERGGLSQIWRQKKGVSFLPIYTISLTFCHIKNLKLTRAIVPGEYHTLRIQISINK